MVGACDAHASRRTGKLRTVRAMSSRFDHRGFGGQAVLQRGRSLHGSGTADTPAPRGSAGGTMLAPLRSDLPPAIRIRCKSTLGYATLVDDERYTKDGGKHFRTSDTMWDRR